MHINLNNRICWRIGLINYFDMYKILSCYYDPRIMKMGVYNVLSSIRNEKFTKRKLFTQLFLWVDYNI